MRTFGTIVLGFIFVLLFDACFLTHAVGGYPLDASAVTSTMRDVNLYDSVLDGLDLALKEAVKDAKQPEMAKEVGSGMKKALEDSMSEDWFYKTFETGYGGFVLYLEGSDEEVEIDLSEQKESLEDYLGSFAEKYTAGDEQAKEQLIKTIDVMPEKATVADLIKDSGSMDEDGLKSARETISTFRTVRIVLFVIALLLLGLIALVAKSTTKRLMVSVGAVLLVSSITFFATSSVANAALWSAVESDMNGKSAGDATDKYAAEVTSKVFKVVLSDAFGRANLPVGGLLVLGVALIGAGIVVGKKKPPAAPGIFAPQQQPFQPQSGQPQPGHQNYPPQNYPPQS
jgi:hypothetical protein